jgi:hypothetical protein
VPENVLSYGRKNILPYAYLPQEVYHLLFFEVVALSVTDPAYLAGSYPQEK